jgi:phosphoglycolate phosphatase-like HAD superfamily hydrolase
MVTENVFWDFDGVILDSMDVRDYGFKEIFKAFKSSEINSLIEYHRLNGGLSRYVKIRYFFENIVKRATSEKEILDYADRFSLIMKEALTNPDNLILDSVNFIKKNHKNYRFHIVSGSDQTELRFLCKSLKLDSYFISIHGSPTPKTKLVQDLISEHNYDSNTSCLIGDSVNDFDAAVANELRFYGYNNIELKNKGTNYISKLSGFRF